MRFPAGARLRPSPSQELLLRVVFGPDDEAQQAWHALRPFFDLDHLEEGSYALMPLLGRRLSEWDVDPELAARLKGIYRHNWYRGNVLLGRLEDLLGVAESRGVEVLVTGEPRLLLCSYRDTGLRAATRLDFVVRPDEVAHFAAGVTEAGWRPAASNQRTTWLERTGGPAVSLREDENAWKHAAPLDAAGRRQRTTSVTDELLRICAGEERRYSWHRLQWIADADALLDTEGRNVDWNRLAARAAATRATTRLHDALRSLREQAGSRIPDEPLAELASTRRGARERLAYRLGR